MAQSQQTITPQQQNMLARNAVIRQSVNMWLPIYTQRFTAANNQGPGLNINLPPRNVGLIKRFVIEVQGNIAAASNLTRTLVGGGNFFSKVEFTDLSNQQRISTTGWHLTAVTTAKRRRAYAAATALDEPLVSSSPRVKNPFGYGNNTDLLLLPETVTTSGTPFRLFFEIPLAYTDHDLRGSVYANVTNAVMNLSLTVNPQLFTVTGARNVQRGMYSGAASAGTLTDCTVTVHQNFLDQLPIAQQGGPVLPLLDLSTAYLMNNTAVSGTVQNQDNPIPFSNFRDFMSATLIYDDAANYVLGGANPINYFALQSANYTNIFKEGPFKNYLDTRLIIGDDYPLSMYYFDFRDKPVSTIQYGNMELLVNPTTVTDSSTAMLVGFESLALINMITQAGSLYGS